MDPSEVCHSEDSLAQRYGGTAGLYIANFSTVVNADDILEQVTAAQIIAFPVSLSL